MLIGAVVLTVGLVLLGLGLGGRSGRDAGYDGEEDGEGGD